MEEYIYMQRALDLAQMGLGKVSPNPLVGAVIVHNGKIIGEGYHQQYGQTHAEVNAINSVSDKSLLSETTMYVTLEPCCHWGKTPPCADLIISNGIKRVVVAMLDPFEKVCGGGVKKMRNAGINVEIGMLKSEAESMNRRFITYNLKKRPYVILKWAESSDKFIDSTRPDEEAPCQISGHTSKILSHRYRTEEDAIMVGSGTAKRDNPSLTARLWKGRNPVRIVMDRKAELSENLAIFDSNAKTILFTDESNITKAKEKYADVEVLGVNNESCRLQQILSALYDHKISSLIVEGGSQLLQSFIDRNLWDEARIFRSDFSINELSCDKSLTGGATAPKINGEILNINKIGNTTLEILKNIRSLG